MAVLLYVAIMQELDTRMILLMMYFIHNNHFHLGIFLFQIGLGLLLLLCQLMENYILGMNQQKLGLKNYNGYQLSIITS